MSTIARSEGSGFLVLFEDPEDAYEPLAVHNTLAKLRRYNLAMAKRLVHVMPAPSAAYKHNADRLTKILQGLPERIRYRGPGEVFVEGEGFPRFFRLPSIDRRLQGHER